MSVRKLVTLTPSDTDWPVRLTERLGKTAPPALQVIGPVGLLVGHKTAIFCSASAPGDAILRAHDTARRLRDDGVTVISGFHSLIEKDCLRILLRGKQPIIICPARAMARMRIPTECRAAFESGRILFLSPFSEAPRRITRDSALRRNEVVAALADEVYIPHITPGGQTAHLVEMLNRWKVPVISVRD